MEKRIALVGIIVSDMSQTPKINAILSGYQEYILGRMGLPHQHHNGEELAIISIAIEAPADVISALSGKLGMIEGITSKVIYHNIKSA
jgi:putative iron-only hydrogenase system regulator